MLTVSSFFRNSPRHKLEHGERDNWEQRPLVCCVPARGSKRPENVEVPGGHLMYTSSQPLLKGCRCPAILVRADMSEDTEIFDSGIRWLAVRVKALKTQGGLCAHASRHDERGSTPRNHA